MVYRRKRSTRRATAPQKRGKVSDEYVQDLEVQTLLGFSEGTHESVQCVQKARGSLAGMDPPRFADWKFVVIPSGRCV